MKVQIIIPVYNLWNKFTKNCIESVVKACEGIEYRILLIDNGSTDETMLEAGKLVSDTFSHMRNEENWGTCRSWNYGIKDAFERGFEYALVLNNDVILHKDSVKQLMDRFLKVKKLSEDVCMITMMDIKGERSNPSDIVTLKVEDKIIVSESEFPNYSAFMVTTDFFDKVGEFDEGFKMGYFEDNDSHRRIVMSGYKAICYPCAMFYHFGSQTINQNPVERIQGSIMFERNKDYYAKKWGGTPSNEKFVYPFDDNTKSLSWSSQVDVRKE